MDYTYKLNYQTLGKRVKECRKLSGMTQEKLAEKVGVTSNFIAKIETSNTTISLQTLIRLANMLETSIDYLLYDNKLPEAAEIDVLIESLLKTFEYKDKEFLLNLVKEIRRYKDESYT